MTAVTLIIISLITNIKVAIIIAITKNDYHNNNNSNNNNNDNNKSTNNNKIIIIIIIFKIITTTSIIIIITRYLKLTRSSYIYCFPHCSFFEKCAFLTLCLYVLTLPVVFKKSGNLFQILGGTYERLFCL